MSYLPLLFGLSATVPGSTYLLTLPFGAECLTSLADDVTHCDPASALRSDRLTAHSVAEATQGMPTLGMRPVLRSSISALGAFVGFRSSDF
jgi:hypothetical protein